ncbi:flagellar filament capping protein FliD [Neptunomonas concharum]|uniref:Flagellar hook-associated protein 2 n=1 Tax=Neptunomonas concharum TaxID=1031538 RepID=A0A5P1R863_9GAMM|nr:flagellar filament capping protein FliD [Neptunomonas concharum]QEQ95787.1 flagellar filament capping protein FliD [Neptunomonas concharum]
MDTNIVSALGGGSGIDTTKLVKDLVSLEKAPQQQRLDSKKEQLDAQISAYGTLKSSLSEFKNILAPLANNDTFNSRSVSFPETDVITPSSLAADAQTGTYQIEVESVAQAHSLASNTTYSDKDSGIGATGNLTIRLGTWTYDVSDNPVSFAENEKQTSLSIEVLAEDSLQDIADKINEQDSDVQASVLLVDGSYQLMMSAPSGAHNALEVSGDDPSLDVFAFNAANYANVTETQQGKDAKVQLNGLTVYRETNNIDDVITGLEFTLNKASPGEKFTFTVSEDKNTGEQAIRDFIEAYNTFFETAKSLTGVSKDAETNQTTRGDLATDGTAKSLIARIRSVITAAVPGVSDFNALTNVGIRTKLDGTLEIVDKDFSAAIKDNFEQVASLFAPQTSSTSSSVDVSIGSYASKTVPGTYSGSISTAPSKGSVIGDAAFAAFNTADTPAGDFSFSVTVDGTTSSSLTLSGDFTTAESLRAELQSLINNDDTLKEAKAFVDVIVAPGGELQLVSREYGSASKVSFDATGTDFATQTGLSTASASTSGVDVAGTINGEAAFGSGNVLLPKIDSDPYGLNLTVKEGASGAFSITYSRGLAGELTSLIDSFLSGSGIINTREENINKQLDGIVDDQENLDRKMTIYESRLTEQYLAMERIIASLQQTGDSLNGILDRLPFTASNN